MDTLYRSEEEGLSRRLALHTERVQEELRLLGNEQDIYAQRNARYLSGLVGALCGVGVFVLGALYDDPSYLSFDIDVTETPRVVGPATWLLIAAPLLCLATYWFTFDLSRYLFVKRFARPPKRREDLPHWVERLSQLSPFAVAKEKARALSLRSLAWPLVAASLLTPLSLHLIAGLFLSSGDVGVFVDFESWIQLSAICVSHCHILLVCLSWRYAKTLSQTPEEGGKLLKGKWWTSVWITGLSAVIPGLHITAALVFITGMVFIPLAYYLAARAFWQEERLLKAE